MFLVNDPNTALAASLRPSRQHPLWAALRRPFERTVPLQLGGHDGADEMPGLRPRSGRWLAAGLLLALGAGLAWLGPERAQLTATEALAAFRGEPLALASLPLRPAPAPGPAPSSASGLPEPSHQAPAAPAPAAAPAITASVVSAMPEARAQASTGSAAPRASAPAASSAPAKKKKARPARSLPREIDRALTKRRAPR